MAVRLPFPEGGKQWTDDRVTILQALGVLDPNGKPTGRLDVVKAADVARPTQEAFDKERAKMLETCTRCHGTSFAKEQLRQGDGLIRDLDHLTAAIRGRLRGGICATTRHTRPHRRRNDGTCHS